MSQQGNSMFPWTSSFAKPNSSQKQTAVRLKQRCFFCQFLAKHNLASTTADHFTDLVRKMFPDSKTAQAFACKRTKTTQIVKRCLSKEMTAPVFDSCRNGPFSLLIDESNDKNCEKRLVVLVRLFNLESGMNTRIHDLPTRSGETAEHVFAAVAKVIEDAEIPWTNMVGFRSDNCNVMMGRNNYVLTRLQEKNPNIFTLGCICHLANLCAKSAVKAISVPVDDILIDIYYIFEHSSKRRSEFTEFQLFAVVPDSVILKHCPTRWLSLEKVVIRMLQQYPALLSYFRSHPECEKPGKVKRILTHLEDPLTKLTFYFLKFVLPLLNEFNRVFEAGESKVGTLIPEMTRLLRKFLCKFVLMRVVKSGELTKVDFMSRENQLTDDLIAVGMDCRSFLTEEELMPATENNFFHDVRQFYMVWVSKMISKFPFGSEILQDLQVFDYSRREKLDYSHIVRLAAKFTPDEDQEDLKDEWENYQLMADGEVVVTDEGKAKKLDEVWVAILSKKTPFGDPMFPVLSKVIPPLLCLPHSNADSEIVFFQC